MSIDGSSFNVLNAIDAITTINTTIANNQNIEISNCLLYTSPSPRDRTRYRMPSSA